MMGWDYYLGAAMEVIKAIEERRARRALDTKLVEREKVDALVEAMRLAPSCNNNQPWRVIVARSPESLAGIKAHIPKGNSWVTRSPLIFVVCGRPEDDCRQSDRRDYFMFGCGLAVGQLTLRATELGLIAHPISGYDPIMIKQALGIPDEYLLVALVVCGYLGIDTSLLSEKQLLAERERPPRKEVGENFFEGVWGLPLQP
jgi:glutaredoxin-dependent peroxiredoxin